MMKHIDCSLRMLALGILMTLLQAATASAQTTWRIEATGHYMRVKGPVRADSEDLSLERTANLHFVCEVSESQSYRFRAEYKNLKDFVFYDGETVKAHRSFKPKKKERVTTDIIVQSGAFPEKLHGYSEVTWQAACLNTLIGRDLTTTSRKFVNQIAKNGWFKKNFGPELSDQLKVDYQTSETNALLRGYLPGDATKNGNRMLGNAYDDRCAVIQLSYSDRDPKTGIYKTFELIQGLPKPDPASWTDVQPLAKKIVKVKSIEKQSGFSLEKPELEGSIRVRDYSTSSGTNLNDAALSRISDWSQLATAGRATSGVAPSTKRNGTKTAKIVVLFGIIAMAGVLVMRKLWVARNSD